MSLIFVEQQMQQSIQFLKGCKLRLSENLQNLEFNGDVESPTETVQEAITAVEIAAAKMVTAIAELKETDKYKQDWDDSYSTGEQGDFFGRESSTNRKTSGGRQGSVLSQATPERPVHTGLSFLRLPDDSRGRRKGR